MDFTNGNAFSNYISSFWTQIFSDSEAIRGLMDANAHFMAQIYQDFVESVNSASIGSINPLHTELVYPIHIRKSEYSTGLNELTFGDGDLFGESAGSGDVMSEYGGRRSSAARYYFQLPREIKSVDGVILNRLHNATIVMVPGSDFVFSDGALVFRDDIFANDLFPKRTVAAGGGAIDEEIVLWVTNVGIENYNLYRQYGHMFFGKDPSGEDYKLALNAIIKLYSGGPSIPRLDSFVAAVCGAPVTTEPLEMVESVESFGGKSLVVTDKNVYQVPGRLALRSKVKPGATLVAGEPLTTATEVFDKHVKPFWWSSVEGLTVGNDFVISGGAPLGFLNAEVPVELTGELNGRKLCKFYLVGYEEDVNKFWSGVNRNSVAAQEFLAEYLWRASDLIDQDGNIDYDSSVYINPLKFLVDEFIGDNAIVVMLNTAPSRELISSLSLLRESIPAYCALLVFINHSTEDTYSFECDTPVVTVSDLSLEDMVSGDLGEVLEENGAAEFLSKSYSPDILAETFGAEESITESVRVKNEVSC